MNRMRYGRAGMTLLALSLPLSGMAAAPDNWNVEGEHGELRVHGELSEGACRLDMSSALQEISLGETPVSALSKTGDRGDAVPLTLRLRDCIRRSGSQQDVRTGQYYWDAIQPVVTVRFNAVADSEVPQLVKASGVSGMGLRIIDAQGKDIRLGTRGRPQWLVPGDNELVYTVRPERTPAPLTAGQYRAVVNFSLDYD